MKKIILQFALVFSTVLLLVGCSIPIGDDTLLISTDGIELVSGDGSDLEEDATDNNNVQDEEKENLGEEDEQEAGDDAQNEDANEADEVDKDENENEGAGASANALNCEKQDHSEITDDIGIDFYFPECAEIEKSTSHPSYVSGTMYLENANWEDIMSEYDERLTDEGITKNKNNKNMKVNYTGKLDSENEIHVTVYQYEEDVYIDFTLYRK